MTPRDIAEMVLGSLSAHRVRTRLTGTAIAIGIGSVLLMTALGEGARRWIIEQFTALGSSALIVMPGRSETRGAAPLAAATTRDLTLRDMETIARRVPGVQRICPIVVGEAEVHYQERGRAATVVGSTSDYLAMRNVRIELGSDLPEVDVHRGMRACLIGRTLARELLGDSNPLGATLRVGEYPFRVVGVIAESGQSLMVNIDDMVLLPVANALRMFNRTGLFRILVQMFPTADLTDAESRIDALLAERHDGERDFTVLTPGSIAASLGRIVAMITAAVAGIAAVSLAVAGVGVMNVMVIAVVERTSEIGLMKAIGASNLQVLALFLAEAVALALLGGALGLVASTVLTHLANALYPAIPFVMPGWAIATALAVACGVGIGFGILPALRAARLEPLQALKRKV